MRNVHVGLALAALVATMGCDRSTGAGDAPDASMDASTVDAEAVVDVVEMPDAGDASVVADAGDGGTGCTPGALQCDGDDVMACSSAGVWELDHACPATETCVDATCLDRCAPEALGTSNLGCTFWAVDLDNEYFLNQGTAAAEQLAVLVANPQAVDVQVEVHRNTALQGSPVVEELVTSVTVLAGGQAQLDLPQREVDGSMGQNGVFAANSGSGTFVSSHGYRISADAPVAAFQFNPVVDAFSNDGTLLLPEHVLGTSYTVVGWPTANPCGTSMMPMESIPDHTAVTVVATQPNTQVTVDTTHDVMASAVPSGLAIPETLAGGQIVVTLGAYDVLNLESLQPVVSSPSDCLGITQDGDFTGTRVTASAPVAVFGSAERGAALGGATPPDPPGWNSESCCTDHLEEQLAPDTALGWQFAVGRSPVRSGLATYQEPDIYRIVATANNTVVSTSLASPFDVFSLQAGEMALFWAYDGFTVDVQGGAVVLGQYLVSAGYVPQNSLGDPSWVTIHPVAQHLTRHLVAIPATYTDVRLVITYPSGTALTLDANPVDATTPGCELAAVGTLGTETYEQLTCQVLPQVHAVGADNPVSVTVFGYSGVSSFAYAGGTGVAPINP